MTDSSRRTPQKTSPEASSNEETDGSRPGDSLDQLVRERPTGDEGAPGETGGPMNRDTAGGLSFLERLSWPSDALGPDEEVLMAVNPSAWMAAPNYFSGSFFFLIGLSLAITHLLGRTPALLNWILPSFITISSSPALWPLVFWGLMALGFVLIAFGHVKRKYIWYIITPKQIMIRRRILSRQMHSVKFIDIEKTEQLDPFPLRLVGVGKVNIYTAGTGGLEAELAMVKRPSQLKQTIREQIPTDRRRRRDTPKTNS
jgi:membrane protein YdbS with pleckstrin-like domain